MLAKISEGTDNNKFIRLAKCQNITNFYQLQVLLRGKVQGILSHYETCLQPFSTYQFVEFSKSVVYVSFKV